MNINPTAKQPVFTGYFRSQRDVHITSPVNDVFNVAHLLKPLLDGQDAYALDGKLYAYNPEFMPEGSAQNYQDVVSQPDKDTIVINNKNRTSKYVLKKDDYTTPEYITFFNMLSDLLKNPEDGHFTLPEEKIQQIRQILTNCINNEQSPVHKQYDVDFSTVNNVVLYDQNKRPVSAFKRSEFITPAQKDFFNWMMDKLFSFKLDTSLPEDIEKNKPLILNVLKRRFCERILNQAR